jgi:hypothetical protein
MGLFGGIFSKQNSGNSTSNSSTTNNTFNTDESAVAGSGATVLGRNASFAADNSTSFLVNDSSNRSITDARSYIDGSNRNTNTSFWDGSDRSSTTSFWDGSDRSSTSTTSFWDGSDRSTTIVGVDPGAVKVAQFGADLVRDLGTNQTEGMKLVAGFGADAMRAMGASATSLYDMAGSNYRNLLQTTQTQSARTSDAWAATLATSAGVLEGAIGAANRTMQSANSLADRSIQQAQPVDGKQADTVRYGVLLAAGLAALFVLPKIFKG